MSEAVLQPLVVGEATTLTHAVILEQLCLEHNISSRWAPLVKIFTYIPKQAPELAITAVRLCCVRSGQAAQVEARYRGLAQIESAADRADCTGKCLAQFTGT